MNLLLLALPALAGTVWLKGQTHAHSDRSADSATPPDEVARWYAARGYDFLVLTDHEVVGGAREPDGLVVVPGVELTQNLRSCEPRPEAGSTCPLHVNALFAAPALAPPWPPVSSVTRTSLYGRALEATSRLGGLAQLNHPNWHRAADADVLSALAARGLKLVEIYNASGGWDEGDATHPSTEALWDAVLARGHTLYGVATDDAHHYDDADAVRARRQEAYVGDRAWVMVDAEKNPAAIRAALEAGRFYASTGVRLETVEVVDGALHVVAAEDVEIAFIGAKGVVSTVRGRDARQALASVEGPYLRAVATDAAGRKAWVQPVKTR